MADHEMRKGVRLLVSGGMAGLDSDTIQRLKKSCEFEQRLRNLSILTEKDAEYLANYVEVCDGYLSQHYDHDDATSRLKMLNEHYSDDELGPNTRKTEVPGRDIAEGWMSSSADC